MRVWVKFVFLNILSLANYQNYFGGGQLFSENRDKWIKHSPFCNDENYMQSPINIDTSLTIGGDDNESTVCSKNKNLEWRFNGKDRDIIVENTGDSLKITAIHSDDKLSNIDNAIKLNREKDTIGSFANYFNINNGNDENREFCFDSIKIHWGRNGNIGSEHKINGKSKALEIHFEHFSCDFDNTKSALNSWIEYGDEGRDIYVIGIVSIMFEIGDENEIIQQILNYHHRLQEHGQSVIIQNVNLNKLIPNNGNNLEYYLYDGSMTLPPCTPCVKWHIIKQIMTLSQTQLDQLITLLVPIIGPDHNNDHNNNKALPTNPNPVYECSCS